MQLETSGLEKEKGPQAMKGRRREAILTFRFSAFPLFRFFFALKPCKRRIFPPRPGLNIALAPST